MTNTTDFQPKEPTLPADGQPSVVEGRARRVRPDRPDAPAATAAVGAEAETPAPHGPLGLRLTPHSPQLMPGETTLLALEITNRTERTATYIVAAEGDLPPAWLYVMPTRVHLQPGQTTSALVRLQPPAGPAGYAGPYQLCLTVRAEQQPAEAALLCADLTLPPRPALEAGPIRPVRPAVDRRMRTLDLVLPVANGGNCALTVQVTVQADVRGLRRLLPLLTDSWLAFPPLQTRLEPGQRRHLPLRLHWRRRLWLLAPRCRLTVEVTTRTLPDESAAVSPQRLAVWVDRKALVGPRRLAAAGLLLLVTLLPLLLAALLVWPGADRSAANPPPPAATARSTPIQIVLELQRLTLPPAGDAESFPAELAPLTALQTDPLQAEAAASAHPPITYGQMFQTVAQEFALSWQLLAAHSFVESRLDARALGRDGEMGLMQVMPATWDEWTPRVVGADAERPYDPWNNLRVGAAYYAYLRRTLRAQGHSEEIWALAAYNWGLENVDRLLTSGQGWEGLPPRQRRYVTDILNLAASMEERDP